MARTANAHGMTLCVPAEFCDQTCLEHTLATNLSKWLPTEARHRIRFWRCSEPKLQCNYIQTLAQTVTLPAGTAAIPAALPHCFNHRPYQRQRQSLMAQHRPSDQGKGPCTTSQTVLKCHPIPRLQQHTAKALIPLLGASSSWQGGSFWTKGFPTETNPRRSCLYLP